ncbi:peptidoglycan D,D-transpeptidase FtsI family protein [Rhodobaculum claviforme]|uniref:Cell division protein FtsI n=1 Tax=Rhodobaculum claviforme TaxID=1549854 RepID=A0A934TJ98_9RHOB|nr:penicillin-binding protein 2 [Rhodobaculum claviforme]MBK5926648.1 cell division protein FtsI [Rhodobaculum claviforme]
MTRTPLRPLARILQSRARGENPDAIERENIRLRAEADRARAHARAEGRLLVLAVAFFLAFSVVGLRMGLEAASDPREPTMATRGGDAITANRADIVDRQGRVLATNLVTHALYAQPPQMVDPARAARELAAIFPDEDAERLEARFTREGARFVWVRRRMSPEQLQAVHDIGEPGLLFGPREMRLYPNGRMAAHVLGGASFGREDVRAAEVIGVAGVERIFDTELRDPAAGGAPLRLSLDLSIQAAVTEVLERGVAMMSARGGTAILMEARTGQIVALVSLPDFDPNDRPSPLVEGDPADSPLFNRAVQGVYELGSVFKAFPVAQALDRGILRPDSIVDTAGPLRWGRFRITDFRSRGARQSVSDIFVHSSNIGTARIAQMMGIEAQQEFLGQIGLLEASPVELTEAPQGRPLTPRNWSELSMMTISYGHGLSVSPMHLAAAYAPLVNGGTTVTPSLVQRPRVPAGEQVISAEASAAFNVMMRETVARGTATMANVAGYHVGGKTGTADKPRATGGYYEGKVIATFVGAWPMPDPEYLLVVTLDEPVETSGTEPRRTAGWTAVPVAGEIIRRTAPMLGMRPDVAGPRADAVSSMRP